MDAGTTGEHHPSSKGEIMADKTTRVDSHEDSVSKARTAGSRGDLEGTAATASHMNGAPGIIERATTNLAMVSPAELRILQQTIGNQAVGHLLRQAGERPQAAVQRASLSSAYSAWLQRDHGDPSQSTVPNQSADPNVRPTQSVDPSLGPTQSVTLSQSVDPNADPNTGIRRRQVIQRDDDGEDNGLGFQVAIPGVGAIALNVSGSGGGLSAAVPGVGAVTLSGSTTADGGIAVAGAGTVGSSSGSFGVAESDGQLSGSAQVKTPRGQGVIGGSGDAQGNVAVTGAGSAGGSSGSFGVAESDGRLSGSAQVKTPDAAGTLSGSADGDGFAATAAGQIGGSSGVFAASEGNGETAGSISVITPNGSGSAQGAVDQEGHVRGSGSLTIGQERVDGGPEIADATRAGEAEEASAPTDPVTIIPPVLRQGSSGAETQHVQNQLNNHGTSPPLTVDGIFGPKTRQAVTTFQADNGLEADGVVGKRTWAKLLE